MASKAFDKAKKGVTVVMNGGFGMNNRWLVLLCCVALAMTAATVYHDIGSHGFIEFDDTFFIEAPLVQGGLTLENVGKAFTTGRGMWFPLTWLSHMVDHQLYGNGSAGPHYTNLFLHITNTILLFLCLFRITGALWRSMFVAALFAVHPLNTETVCYISCRKGLLSTFFWFASVWAYAVYAARPSAGRYLFTAALFGLGMMAKPMLVTIPVIFLILDYWPLKRFDKVSPWHLVREKLPLLVISLTFGVLTILVQQRSGAVSSLADLPVSLRLSNAMVSYLLYIYKMFIPVSLAVFYPYPTAIPLWKSAGCAAIIFFMTVRAYRAREKAPWFFAGWLWYLVALLPVIGLVQVGQHAMADRYAYIPLVGLFVAGTWHVADRVYGRLARRSLVAALAVVITLALGIASARQSAFWKDSITLFEHALKVTPESALVHNNMGKAFYKKGDLLSARRHIAAALRLEPYLPQANYNKGLLLLKAGMPDAAIPCLLRAIDVKPDFVKARYTLANILFNKKRFDEALNHYAYILKHRKDLSDKLLADVYNDMGVIYVRHGKNTLAESYFRNALALNPGLAAAHNNLGLLLTSTGRPKEALPHFEKAVSLRPGFMDAVNNLVAFYRERGEYGKGIEFLKKTVSFCPDSTISIYYNIACLYSLWGKKADAVKWLKKSIDKGFCLWDLLKNDRDLENIRDTEYYRKVTGKAEGKTMAVGRPA